MHPHTISPIPATIGALLWLATSCLLIEDNWRGHLTLAACLQPLLSTASIAAAVLAHHRLASWKISGLAFALLAVLGATAMLYGVLSRTATARDTAVATAMAENRTLSLKEEELVAAKASAKRECVVQGDRCRFWTGRIDQLTTSMSSLRAVATDPRSDAIAKLAFLLGFDGKRVREVVSACDPLILPLFLEFAAALFWIAALPHRKAGQVAWKPAASYSREEALADFLRLRQVGSQQFLASRWGVSEGLRQQVADAVESRASPRRPVQSRAAHLFALSPIRFSLASAIAHCLRA